MRAVGMHFREINMRKTLPAFVAILSFSNPALSQEDPDLVTEQVVVTATRFADTYFDKPVNVTVITRQEIERSTAQSVPDLLAAQSGIGARDLFGNNAASTTVDIRGFGAAAGQNALILLDGRRINDIDISGVQWSAIPLARIERVEIVRGAGAVQYGDGAITGVVNIITRQPRAGDAAGNVTFSGGSYDTLAAEAGAAIAGDNAGIRIDGSRLISHGYRANNDNRQGVVSADLRWFSAADHLSLKIAADRQDLRLPGGRFVQPSIGLNELQSDRQGTSTPLDFATRDGDLVNAEWARKFASSEFNIGAGYRRKQQKSYFDFGGFPDYREIGLEVISLTPRLRIQTDSFGLDGALISGFDWYSWRYDLAIAGAPALISQPVHRVDADQQNHAVYLIQNLAVTSGTTVSAGGRVEWFDLSASDRFDPAAPNPAFFPGGSPLGEQNERQSAWDLGLRQRLSPANSAYARIGRSFRFATVDEIYEMNTAFSQSFQFLRPQTARTMELGWEHGGHDGAGMRLTVFRMNVDNEIHLNPFSLGVGNSNLPPSRREGVEFEARRRLSGQLSVAGNYTYTRARFLEGEFSGRAFAPSTVDLAGKTVPLVPSHRASISADWRVRPELTLTAMLQAASSQFMDNDEANDLGTKIPGYAAADLRLAYTSGRWRLAAQVNNVLDREYYTYAVRSNFTPDRYAAYPLPERNFFVAVEYRFGP